MNAIRENPYRTLGLFGNSSEKDLQRQLSRLKAYTTVGKSTSCDYDFPFLGDFKREAQTVASAASKIEQAKNKVHYSLFWFLNTTHIDEAALNHLKEANIDKATEIWEKLIKDNTITAKNYSAAINLSTLQLGMTTLNGSFNPAQLKKCVELKGHVIASDAFLNFVQTVAGDNISVSKETIRKEFVDEILQILKPYLNKSKGITSAQLIDAFSSFPTETKQYLSAKFTDRPLSNIDNQIEKTKQKRTGNANDAEEYGAELYKNTKEDLTFLKNVLGANNVNYQVLVNKVANEILQCAIDFFIEYRDTDEYDPGDEALKLIKMAKAISPNGQVKTRVEENIQQIQEWIHDKPERERNRKIKDDLEFIGGKLERFQNLSDTVANAKDLVISCKPKLYNMKRALGSTNDFYLKISSAVVGNAQGMLVTAVNAAQEGYSKSRNFGAIGTNLKYVTIIDLMAVISEALEVIFMLEGFGMESNLRECHNKNLVGIKSLATQFHISVLGPREIIQKEIRDAESTLKSYQSMVFLKNEIDIVQSEMTKIQEWQFMRSSEDKQRQINQQQSKINQVKKRSEQEKAQQIKTQEEKISSLKIKLNQLV
jgi:hypothetical protein